jgi:hypothetical protein
MFTSCLCYSQVKPSSSKLQSLKPIRTSTTKASTPLPMPEKEVEPGLKTGDLGKVNLIYQGKSFTYTTVRASDGNIWLQQNLGSKRVANDLRDEDGMGDLFQWGRWDDGHQLINDLNVRHTDSKTNPSMLNKSGMNPFYYDIINVWWSYGTIDDKWTAATPNDVSETVGCDPCKALGAEWRLPTWDEFEKEINLEYKSMGGYLTNLKLTLGGYKREEGSELIGRARAGMYWTSTAYNNGIAVAYDNVSGKFGGFHRGRGMSIRCLKLKSK